MNWRTVFLAAAAATVGIMLADAVVAGGKYLYTTIQGN